MFITFLFSATRAILTLRCCTLNEAHCVTWTFSKGLWGVHFPQFQQQFKHLWSLKFTWHYINFSFFMRLQCRPYTYTCLTLHVLIWRVVNETFNIHHFFFLKIVVHACTTFIALVNLSSVCDLSSTWNFYWKFFLMMKLYFKWRTLNWNFRGKLYS